MLHGARHAPSHVVSLGLPTIGAVHVAMAFGADPGASVAPGTAGHTARCEAGRRHASTRGDALGAYFYGRSCVRRVATRLQKAPPCSVPAARKAEVRARRT